MSSPDLADVRARLERLEELAMYAERESVEARASIADVVSRLAALTRRLAAIEDRILRLPLAGSPATDPEADDDTPEQPGVSGA